MINTPTTPADGGGENTQPRMPIAWNAPFSARVHGLMNPRRPRAALASLGATRPAPLTRPPLPWLLTSGPALAL
jgi:hypothetical protein